jgi:hypothetical protein
MPRKGGGAVALAVLVVVCAVQSAAAAAAAAAGDGAVSLQLRAEELAPVPEGGAVCLALAPGAPPAPPLREGDAALASLPWQCLGAAEALGPLSVSGAPGGGRPMTLFVDVRDAAGRSAAPVSARAVGVAPPAPSIAFTAPAAGALLAERELEVRFELAGFNVPADGVVAFNNTKMEYTHETAATSLTLRGLEPGTHVLEARLLRRADGAVLAAATLHWECVLSRAAVLRERHVPAERGGEAAPAAAEPAAAEPAAAGPAAAVRAEATCAGGGACVKPPLGLCFVGTMNVDGQKTIWLQQLERLPRSRFRPAFVTFAAPEEGFMLARLRELGVPVHSAPLLIHPADEGIGEDVVADLAAYLLRRLRAAGSAVDAVRPPWAARLWRTLVGAFEAARADVVVFANSRHDNDKILVAAARLAGVR